MDPLDHSPDGFQPDASTQCEPLDTGCLYPDVCALAGKDHTPLECHLNNDLVELRADDEPDPPPPENFWREAHRGRCDIEVFYKPEARDADPKLPKSRVYRDAKLFGSVSAMAEATQYLADHVGTRDVSHIALSNFRPS